MSAVHAGAMEAGAFRLLTWPGSDLPELNYALPVRSTRNWRRAVGQLDVAFAKAGRSPRVEVIVDLWPDADAALRDSGWQLAGEAPVMALTPTTFQPAPLVEGIAERWLNEDDADDRLDDFLGLQSTAFGFATERLGRHRIVDLRQELSGGSMRTLTMLEGGRVLAAASLLGEAPLAELAGVAVRPEARGRGCGARACSVVLDGFFHRGGQVAWLVAEAPAVRLYARLGFSRVATHRTYRRA
jgi:ribosomal protein S18 acetylase RimI-like enzyme